MEEVSYSSTDRERCVETISRNPKAEYQGGITSHPERFRNMPVLLKDLEAIEFLQCSFLLTLEERYGKPVQSDPLVL